MAYQDAPRVLAAMFPVMTEQPMPAREAPVAGRGERWGGIDLLLTPAFSVKGVVDAPEQDE